MPFFLRSLFTLAVLALPFARASRPFSPAELAHARMLHERELLTVHGNVINVKKYEISGLHKRNVSSPGLPSGSTPPPPEVVNVKGADFTSGACWKGTSKHPTIEDCRKLAKAQFKKDVVFVTTPGTFVVATFKSCHAYFVNRVGSPYSFEFSWSALAKPIGIVDNNCFHQQDPGSYEGGFLRINRTAHRVFGNYSIVINVQ